eukprot:498578-Hanusia_phi.AAC.1
MSLDRLRGTVPSGIPSRSASLHEHVPVHVYQRSDQEVAACGKAAAITCSGVDADAVTHTQTSGGKKETVTSRLGLYAVKSSGGTVMTGTSRVCDSQADVVDRLE